MFRNFFFSYFISGVPAKPIRSYGSQRNMQFSYPTDQLYSIPGNTFQNVLFFINSCVNFSLYSRWLHELS